MSNTDLLSDVSGTAETNGTAPAPKRTVGGLTGKTVAELRSLAGELGVGETTVVAEYAVRSLGVPRRHVASFHRIMHLVRFGLRAFVVDQRERAQTAGVVASRTILIEDRRNVLGERRLGAPSRERLRLACKYNPNYRDADHADRREPRTRGMPSCAAIQIVSCAHWAGGLGGVDRSRKTSNVRGEASAPLMYC